MKNMLNVTKRIISNFFESLIFLEPCSGATFEPPVAGPVGHIFTKCWDMDVIDKEVVRFQK